MKKSERLNKELLFLKDKHAFNLNELMSEFNISKSTALRDIKSLEELGLALYSENGRSGGYQLLDQSLVTPIYFDQNEIFAIFFALKALELVSNTPFDKSYTHIQSKLMLTLSPNQQKDIETLLSVVKYFNTPPVKTQTNLAEILESILNETAIRVTYNQYEEVELTLQSNELFYRNGIWFFSAYDFTAKKWGTYRSDCVKTIEILDSYAHALSIEELNQIQETYEQEYHDNTFRCRLSEFGQEIFHKHRYPNMTLEIKDGISYIVGGYNQDELPYMVHFLMRFGNHVTVEYPEKLKDSYLQELQSIIQKYN